MSEPLKDQLFHRANVTRIAREIAAVHPPFDVPVFIDDVVARFPELELKQRIAWISECLRKHLPDDFRTAVGVLLDALPPPCDPTRSDGDFGDFIYAPYSHFVASNGCTDEHVAFSLDALREITMRFSAGSRCSGFIARMPGHAPRGCRCRNGDRYAISFPTARGRVSRKVYKLRRLTLTSGVPATVEWRHALRANMTTRPIVAGEHIVEVLINGRASGQRRFEVAD